MWLFTLDGFYSAVQDRKDNNVIWVRARVREDLERLIETYEVNATEIYKDAGTDYKFRIGVWREEWVRVVADCANDIDYSNFKDAVHHELGKDRAAVLGNVWWELYKLQLDGASSRFYGLHRSPLENFSKKETEANPSRGEPISEDVLPGRGESRGR